MIFSNDDLWKIPSKWPESVTRGISGFFKWLGDKVNGVTNDFRVSYKSKVFFDIFAVTGLISAAVACSYLVEQKRKDRNSVNLRPATEVEMTSLTRQNQTEDLERER